MAPKFSFLVIVTLLGFTSTLSHGATVGTLEPIIMNDDGGTSEPIIMNEVLDDDGTPIEVSNGRVMDDFSELILKEKESFEMLNPTHVNGEELFESDIMLSPEQREALAQRKAINSNTNYRWVTGSDGYPHVPYIFGDNNVTKAAVLNGIAHWEKHTCIKFDNASDLTAPHLKFIKSTGCWSYVGRIWTWAGQKISIGNGCTGLGIVVHEIGHALGFFHEQSRNDRDSYIVINTANIRSGKEGNFNKKSASAVSNYSVPYDFTSDMHYGGTYFTKNGHLTIATVNPLAQELIGSRGGLSHRDKLLANRMYPCIAKWLADCGKPIDPCQNDGYTGADCACVCPPGTNGTNCENVFGDYYDSKLSGLSVKITSETNVMSPNHPNKYPRGKIVKWIVAPECQQVELTFSSFRLYKQTTCNDGQLCCNWDSLEIRTSNLYDGDLYCGQMITNGMSFTSESNQMILYFETATNYYSGFNASIKFVEDPSCTSTSVSTPSPAAEVCRVEKYNEVSYWSSPNFGQQNYPNNFSCGINQDSDRPLFALIKFQPLILERPRRKVCLDEVRITSTYGLEKSYCGVKTRKIVKLPSYSFSMDFQSDSNITNQGFNISIQAKTSPCHQIFNLTSLGETGEFKTPFYPRKDRKRKRMCEVWFIAPSPYHVQLDFLGFKLKNPCRKNNLVINPYGDHKYPKATSSRHCFYAIPPTMRSNETEIDLVYMANKRNRGFSVKYTVVQSVK